MRKRTLFQAIGQRGQKVVDGRVHLNVCVLPEELALIERRIESAGLGTRSEYIRTLIFTDLRVAGMIPNGDENGEG